MYCPFLPMCCLSLSFCLYLFPSLFFSIILVCRVCVCIAAVAVFISSFFFSSLALFNISMKIRTNYFQFELNTAIALRSMWCMRAFVYVRKLASVYTIRWLHSKSDWMVKFITFYAIESSRFAWCLCVCVCFAYPTAQRIAFLFVSIFTGFPHICNFCATQFFSSFHCCCYCCCLVCVLGLRAKHNKS